MDGILFIQDIWYVDDTMTWFSGWRDLGIVLGCQYHDRRRATILDDRSLLQEFISNVVLGQALHIFSFRNTLSSLIITRQIKSMGLIDYLSITFQKRVTSDLCFVHMHILLLAIYHALGCDLIIWPIIINITKSFCTQFNMN